MNINSPKACDIIRLRRLWSEAFGDGDEFLDAFFDTAFAPERALAVYDDGDIIAALYWFDCECRGKPVAYIYAVATAKASRGKGVCHALMAEAHRRLSDRGYCGAVLVPGEKSLFDFYATMGYKQCTNVSVYECMAFDAGISIHKINKAEYEHLRRKYLPDGGIIQEKENTDFLETQVGFYCGTDFVMAAVVRDKILGCAEIVGNTECMEGIVYSMDCDKGYFRTAGDDIPFAMYRPLDEIGDPPKYFGLAFD